VQKRDKKCLINLKKMIGLGMTTKRKKRRTKEEILAENRELIEDVGSALNYITFQTSQELREFANSYRSTSGVRLLTLTEIKKGIRILTEQGMIRKRKDKYAYVNGK